MNNYDNWKLDNPYDSMVEIEMPELIYNNDFIPLYTYNEDDMMAFLDKIEELQCMNELSWTDPNPDKVWDYAQDYNLGESEQDAERIYLDSLEKKI